MRILHVIHGLAAVYGGPPAAVMALASAQAQHGDQVVVLSTRRLDLPLVMQLGRYGNLTVADLPITHDAKWFDRTMIAGISEFARNSDIVHVHGNWRYHLRAAAKAAQAAGIPYVISPHGNLDEYCFGHKKYVKWPYFMLLERGTMNRAGGIHCCSEKELTEVSRQPIAARKFIVPNPIKIDLLSEIPDNDLLERQIPQLKQGQKVILSLGRIHPIKKLEVILDGFARLAADFTDWLLVFAGNHEVPEYVTLLQERIVAHGLGNRVLLPGSIHGAAKVALLRRTSIYAQASAHENFCLSVAEAFLFAIPCVITHTVALARDAEQAGCGIACEGTATEFAVHFRRLMSDADLRQSIGENGPAVAERYYPDAVQKLLAEEYRRCIDEHCLARVEHTHIVCTQETH